MVNTVKRPVWAEINLDHLAHNMEEVVKNISGGTIPCAVIKANGYGHGALEISGVLREAGARRFAVATLTEAIELRRGGIEIPVHVMGYTPEEFGDAVLDHEIIQTIDSLKQGRAFNEFAKRRNQVMKVHLKIDTGMSRLGFQVNEETVDEILELFKLPNLEIEGIFTHFAMADDKDKAYTYSQWNQFQKMINWLERDHSHEIPVKHVSNSAAIIDLPEMNLDMVRPGIMLYGLYPSEDVNRNNIKLKKVMEVHGRLAHVKELEPGRGVSYGHAYHTSKDTIVGTIPAGYADGFTRMLTGKAQIVYQGNPYPVIGRICMDQFMADLTGTNPVQGDKVVIMSSDDSHPNTADDFARQLGTINYEIVCMVGRRVPRVYRKNGRILHVIDHLLTR